MKTRALFFAMSFVVAGLLFAAMPAKPASANNYGHGVHCVRYGETLYSIGRYYGVSAYAIAKHNGIVNPNYVRAGACLHIPSGYGHGGYHQPAKKVDYGHGGYHQPAKQPNYGHGGYGTGWHQVKYGETLYSIARWYGVSPWSIAKANGLYNVNYIRAGQSLYIPTY